MCGRPGERRLQRRGRTAGRRRCRDDDVSNDFRRRRITRRAAAGRRVGAVWEWHSGSGWHAVPGSEATSINGLEISRDGKFFYIAGWGDQTFIRLERAQTPIKRDVLPMPFRIDNLRLMSDGTLF